MYVIKEISHMVLSAHYIKGDKSKLQFTYEMFTNKKDDMVAFFTCGVTTMLSPLFTKTQYSII
jgi:hypothetical protein